MTCKKCGINYKRLTKEQLCASCYKKTTGKWAKEFSQHSDGKGGKK